MTANAHGSNGLPQRWQRIALTTDLGLLVLVIAWQILPIPSINGAVKAAALSLPLLLPLYGLVKGNRYTFRWATLCVLPYFVVGVTEVMANPSSRPIAAAMLTLALFWFVALVAYLRVTADPPRITPAAE